MGSSSQSIQLICKRIKSTILFRIIIKNNKSYILYFIFPYLLSDIWKFSQEENILSSPMFNPFVLSLLVLLAHTQTKYPSFDQYLINFQKKYTQQQLNQRRIIYNNNIRKFTTITDYEPGVNNMTDWKQEQIQSRANLLLLNQKKNFTTQFPSRLVKVGHPLTLDWRQKGIVTPVRSQAQCGACWAFATAAYAQSYLILKQRFDRKIDLSQKYLLECTPLSFCSGGFIQYGMAVGLKMPLQKTYPFSQSEKFEGICSSQGINVAKYSNNYYDLTDSQIITLLQQSPLAISIASKDWHKYGKGVFSCTPNAKVDHAVLLVGYTPNYWIVKNQWGTEWGNNGFMYITRVRQKNCGIGYSVHTMKQEGSREKDSYFIELMREEGVIVDEISRKIKQKYESMVMDKWVIALSLWVLLVIG